MKHHMIAGLPILYIITNYILYMLHGGGSIMFDKWMKKTLILTFGLLLLIQVTFVTPYSRY